MDHWLTLAVRIVVVVVLAVALHIIVHRAVARVVKASEKRAQERATGAPERLGATDAAVAANLAGRSAARTRTVGQGIGVLVDLVLAVVVVLTVLTEFGINLSPLLASAGIGGIVLGFGAQSLVKDLISGIFLIIEDQFGVGDIITIGTLQGTVQAVGPRVLRLQDFSGQIWYIRNGEIATLGNLSQGWSTSQVAFPVSHTEDPLRIIRLLQETVDGLDADPQWAPHLLEPPTVLGLTSFDNTQMTFTVLLKCPANKQWGVEREVRRRVLMAFQAHHVKSPVQIIESVVSGG